MRALQTAIVGATETDARAETGLVPILETLGGWLQEARFAARSDPQRLEYCLDWLESLLAEAKAAPRHATAAAMASGGLAPWQVARVKCHVEASLGNRLTTADLAALVDLSEHYFNRAFKVSLGCPPHAYVLTRRITRARTLMLETDMPLSQVALAAGLTDQAHLSRLFRRYFGEPPSSWRRRHRIPPQRTGYEPPAAPIHLVEPRR